MEVTVTRLQNYLYSYQLVREGKPVRFLPEESDSIFFFYDDKEEEMAKRPRVLRQLFHDDKLVDVFLAVLEMKNVYMLEIRPDHIEVQFSRLLGSSEPLPVGTAAKLSVKVRDIFTAVS